MFELCTLAAHRGELRAGVLAKRVGLVDVRGCRNPLLVAVARELVGAIVDLDSVREQRNGSVVAAQTEILARHLGLESQRDSAGVPPTARSLLACSGGPIAAPA